MTSNMNWYYGNFSHYWICVSAAISSAHIQIFYPVQSSPPRLVQAMNSSPCFASLVPGIFWGKEENGRMTFKLLVNEEEEGRREKVRGEDLIPTTLVSNCEMAKFIHRRWKISLIIKLVDLVNSHLRYKYFGTLEYFTFLGLVDHLVSRAKGNCTTFHRSFTRHLWPSGAVLNFIRPRYGWQKLEWALFSCEMFLQCNLICFKILQKNSK